MPDPHLKINAGIRRLRRWFERAFTQGAWMESPKTLDLPEFNKVMCLVDGATTKYCVLLFGKTWSRIGEGDQYEHAHPARIDAPWQPH